ncbi:hypothetical protein AB0K21_22130 [Streptosporangium sp. NPDC049248]|uniref:hypothetical protein n=1 Tax=Streptosporangium sp. NPDC049248 TaxID=3155651 RepID=UPI00343F5F78
MSSDLTVDLQQIVAVLRRKHTAVVDELTYENAVLAAAVEQLQERAGQLEQQLTEMRGLGA